MFYQNKKIQFFLSLCFFAVAAFLTMVLLENEALNPTISNLNSKHGLIFTESLNGKTNPLLLALFNPHRFLRANLSNIMKPKKELILKLNDENSDSELQNVLILNFETDGDIRQIASDYENLDIVKYAEPNFDLKLPASKTVPAVDSKKIEPTGADSENKTGILIAVIDSGVDDTHPDFGNRIEAGWNFLDDTRQVVDQDGHGTHVAGIILENSTAAKIMPLKISDGKSGKMRELVQAIKFAADNGAQIINLSLGLQKESEVLQEAIDYADERNVIVVAVAGNYRSSEKYYPAASPNVIAVSALKNNGKKLFLSNFGEWVDFSTVAQDVWSAAPNEEHAYRTGTSQAAPVVAAKIADILAVSDEAWNLQKVRDYLIENSEPIAGRYELGREILTTAQ